MKNFLKLGCMVLIAFGCSSSINTRATSDNLETEILQHTNQFRKSQRLIALSEQKYLHQLAEQHSRNMARKKVSFGHDGFNKRNALAAKNIKGLSAFAENVAYGKLSGSAVVDLWKNSAGHRKNMLGNYTHIGIGVAAASDGTLYYTQIFAK